MVMRSWVKRIAVVVFAALLVGCNSSPKVTTVIGWSRGPLAIPFVADRRALVVDAGQPPTDLTEGAALRLAHDSLGDLAAIAAAERECAGCVAGNGKPITLDPVPGRVTLAVTSAETTGPVRRLVRTAAWLIPFTPWSVFCPAEPDPPPDVPPSASDLDVLIVTGPRLDDVVVYHGTGSGVCRRRTHPVVAFDPPTNQGGDVG